MIDIRLGRMAALVLAGFGVTGCTSDMSHRDAYGQIPGLWHAITQPGPAARCTRCGDPGPARLQLTLPDHNWSATFTPVAQRNGNVTWQAGRGDMSRNLGQAPSATVTTRNGVIIATRGLGDDLIAADITDLERAKAGTTPITGQREHRYLRANGDIQSAVFICNYTQTVQHGTEDCTGARRKIKNHYTQTKTRQWIGPNLGYAQTLSLKNKP